MKTKILSDFHICISAPLKYWTCFRSLNAESKHPQKLFCTHGLLESPGNLFMLKLLHVDFNLLDGSEKNMFSLRATAKISECCKIRSNCKKKLQNKLRRDCGTSKEQL